MIRRSATILIAALALLTACDGPTQVAGIQGSGLTVGTTQTVGPITSFGSIFVNGVEYATSGAQILIDGQPGTETQLETGQIVSVTGTINADGTTGSATEVDFNGNVQGPVTQIDSANNTLTILGQAVQITAATLLDPSIQPADLTGLQLGEVVEVSGFADASGATVASRVDLKASGSALQVRGAVQNLDATGGTFAINSLKVNYSSATVTGMLADGSTIEVHGTTLDPSGALLATHIEVLPGLGTSANQHADLDGIITTFTSSSNFVLLGQQVTTDANTRFILHGATLGLNLEVDVKGAFNASGELLAATVEAKPHSSSYVRGWVESVTASNNTLSVLGVQVVTSRTTELDDRSSQPVRQFRLTDLRIGDYVEVDGAEAPAGTLNAAVLQRENGNGSGRSYLQGVATALAQPSFTVLGTTVTTTAQTSFVGPGGAATFFAQAANHLVKVSGTFANGALTADQVQILQ